MLKFKINSKHEELNSVRVSSSRLSQISTYSSDELKSVENGLLNSTDTQHRTIISINDSESDISKAFTSSHYSMESGVKIKMSTSLSSLSSIDSGEGTSDVVSSFINFFETNFRVIYAYLRVE